MVKYNETETKIDGWNNLLGEYNNAIDWFKERNIPYTIDDLLFFIHERRAEPVKTAPELSTGFLGVSTTLYDEQFDLRNYIILPGKQGNPDLEVSMHRLCYSKEVEKAAKEIDLIGLQNTAKELDGYGYMGNIKFEEAITLNLLLNHFTFNLGPFWDFRGLLRKGIYENKKIYDGCGRRLGDAILNKTYNEIFISISHSRGEWIGEMYKLHNNTLCSYKDYKLKNGVLKPKIVALKPHLRRDCYVDLENCNENGLPTREGREIYYTYPRDNFAAWFRAGSVRTGLNCFRSPSDSVPLLGVRPIRIRS